MKIIYPLDYFRDLLRNYSLDVLFRIVGYLSQHKLSHAAEDTAELTDNRKGLRVSFTFHGRVQEITLPYDPYRINHRRVIVTEVNKTIPLLDTVSCVPGLDDFIFTKEAQGYIHDREIETVAFEENEDDD